MQKSDKHTRRKVTNMRLEETGSLFNNMATIMVAMGILTFILLSFGLTAPYGKYSLTAGSVWGPGMNGA